MTRIKPFAGLCVTKDFAQCVSSPPYDAITTEAAREIAAKNPNTFLRVSKSEIDFPPGTDPHTNNIYEKAKDNFNKLCDEKILVRDEQPCFYIYEIKTDKTSQTGLVALASIQDYLENKIHKHELTKAVKVDDRCDHMKAIKAQTGPVMLTFVGDDKIKRLLLENKNREADLTVKGVGNTTHSIWRVQDNTQPFTDYFEGVTDVYIADGHHRSEAAAKADDKGYFLSVLFPSDELNILGYHRVIKDLNGLTEDEFLSQLDKTSVERPLLPTQNNEFGMYLKEQWYKVALDSSEELPVTILSQQVLEPMLGIKDQKTDPNIDFVGGNEGIDAMVKLVDSGKMKLGITLCPATIDQVIKVSDENKIMPPKSTWFEPKLADGLISYLMD